MTKRDSKFAHQRFKRFSEEQKEELLSLFSSIKKGAQKQDVAVRQSESASRMLASFEELLRKVSSSLPPVITVGHVRETLRNVYIQTEKLRTTLEGKETINELVACPWPGDFQSQLDTIMAAIFNQIEMLPPRRGAPRPLLHPGHKLAMHVHQFVSEKSRRELKPTRGSNLERILRIAFDALGMSNVADPLSFLRRELETG